MTTSSSSSASEPSFLGTLLPSRDFTAIDRDSVPESLKWQLAVSNGLQHSAIGFLTGGAASLVVARSLSARVGLAALGAGFGVGRAYVDMRYLFNHDVAANRTWIASVTPRPPAPPPPAASE